MSSGKADEEESGVLQRSLDSSEEENYLDIRPPQAVSSRHHKSRKHSRRERQVQRSARREKRSKVTSSGWGEKQRGRELEDERLSARLLLEAGAGMKRKLDSSDSESDGCSKVFIESNDAASQDIAGVSLSAKKTSVENSELMSRGRKESATSDSSRASTRSSVSRSSTKSSSSTTSSSTSFQTPKLDPENNGDDNTELYDPELEFETEDLPCYFPAIEGCRSVNEYEILKRIAEGAYGVVYRAKDRHTEEIVALKKLKMEKEKEGFPITSLREINTLLKAQHPNIVSVREIVVNNNIDKIFIVMEYIEYDLKAYMAEMKEKKEYFRAGEVKCLMLQFLRAVAHLHDNWILHRDLKTSNLLLSSKGILKLGDFGLAREYGSPLKPYTPLVVTLWYRAPELLLGIGKYSTSIDMWSVGCIFGEMLRMETLFDSKTEIEQINRIFKALGTPDEKTWPGFSLLPALQSLKLINYPGSLWKKFNKKLTYNGMLLLKRFLTCNPEARIKAKEAQDHDYFKEAPLPLEPEELVAQRSFSKESTGLTTDTALEKMVGGDFQETFLMGLKEGSQADFSTFRLRF